MTTDDLNISEDTKIKTNIPVMKWLVVAGFGVGTWATFISVNLSRVVDELGGLRKDMQEISAVDKRVVRLEFQIVGLQEELARMKK